MFTPDRVFGGGLSAFSVLGLNDAITRADVVGALGTTVFHNHSAGRIEPFECQSGRQVSRLKELAIK